MRRSDPATHRLFLPKPPRLLTQISIEAITPASSGTVDANLGFVYYPGGGARNALQKRYVLLLQTASNTSFAVDLPR